MHSAPVTARGDRGVARNRDVFLLWCASMRMIMVLIDALVPLEEVGQPLMLAS